MAQRGHGTCLKSQWINWDSHLGLVYAALQLVFFLLHDIPVPKFNRFDTEFSLVFFLFSFFPLHDWFFLILVLGFSGGAFIRFIPHPYNRPLFSRETS